MEAKNSAVLVQNTQCVQKIKRKKNEPFICSSSAKTDTLLDVSHVGWEIVVGGREGQSVPVPFVMSRLVLSVDFLLYFSAWLDSVATDVEKTNKESGVRVVSQSGSQAGVSARRLRLDLNAEECF